MAIELSEHEEWTGTLIGLCSWASHLTHRVRLSYPAEQMGTGKLIVGL